MGIWILFIVSLVVATILVNGVQRLFMKWLNISVMFGKTRTKVIAIIVVALLLAAICTQIFEIEIPINTGGNAPANTSNTRPGAESSDQTSEFVIVDNVLLKYNAKNSTSITIPDKVTEIGDSAFKDCVSLESVTIPDSVMIIEKFSFSGCISLKSVTMGTGVTEIGVDAFSGCSSLINITIPNSVTTIWLNAFKDCSSLKSIAIPDSVIVKQSLDGANMFIGCTSLTDVTLGSGMEKIPMFMFSGCTSLENITIPDSVTEIGLDAFEGCTSLSDAAKQKISQINGGA